MFEYELTRTTSENERNYEASIRSSFVEFKLKTELKNNYKTISYSLTGEHYWYIKPETLHNMLKSFLAGKYENKGGTHNPENDEVFSELTFDERLTYQDFYLISEFIAVFAIETVRVAFGIKRKSFLHIIKSTDDESTIVKYENDFMPSIVCLGAEDSTFHMIGKFILFPAYLIPRDRHFNPECLQATGFYIRKHNEKSKTGDGMVYTFRDLGEIDPFWNSDLLSTIKKNLRNYYHKKTVNTSNTFLRLLEIMMALKLSNYQQFSD